MNAIGEIFMDLGGGEILTLMAGISPPPLVINGHPIAFKSF